MCINFSGACGCHSMSLKLLWKTGRLLEFTYDSRLFLIKLEKYCILPVIFIFNLLIQCSDTDSRQKYKTQKYIWAHIGKNTSNLAKNPAELGFS